MNQWKFIGISLLIWTVPFSAFAQLESLEDIEKTTKKGFFKTYFTDTFKSFTDFGDPFTMSGGVGLNMRSYDTKGGPLRQDPFFYGLNANLNFRFYQLNVPFSLTITARNQDSSLPSVNELVDAFKNNVRDNVRGQRDRFIRFGMSPHYKWMKLHLGHRSMNFSKFTLANLNFFGVGTELTPGNIRVSAMYGRLAKAEPLDLSLNTPNIPIYERMGWGAKLGYGTEQHSIDFIVFGAEDDPNSISNLGDAPKQPNPEENLTLGINLQTLIFERFRFRAESGLSALTLNARDAQSESTSFPSFLFTEKMSTQTNLAIDTRLDYEGEKFLAGVQFKRVDPNYRSLGAYFFNNDMIEYLGNLEFDLLNQKMNVGLSGGIQANNLDLSKPSTTQRFVYSASLSYALDAFSANANYSNNTTDIGYVLNQELDSLNAVVITQNAGVDLSYTIADENKNQHVITLGGNIQEVGDDIANPIESAKSKMMVAHLAYNFMLSESKWRFTTRANYNQNEIAQMLITRYGFGGGISKSLLEDKMNLGLDVNYFINSSDVNTNSTNLTSQFRFGYKIGKGLSVNLNLGVLRTDSEQQTDPFSEMTGKLGIQYNFTVKPKKKKKKTADKKENEDASKENSEEK